MTPAPRNAKVGVLMGGLSAERAISLVSGEAVLEALRARGHDAVALLVDRDVDIVLRRAAVDVVFNALHGRYGEDGCIQGLLEVMGIPYTGSGVLASALAMNKVKAKELFRLHSLPTPPYYLINSNDRSRLAEVHGAFGFPVVAKPIREGSSLGVSVATDLNGLIEGCNAAFELDSDVLVERFIAGHEVSVGILNGRALGALSVVSHNRIFDYGAKYTAGQAHYHVPARLPEERYQAVLTQALLAHQVLGCTGATRVDMIVSELGNEYILEVNTLPGLTPRSLLPRIARHAGLDYADLIEEILAHAGLNTRAGVDPAAARAPRDERSMPNADATPIDPPGLAARR